MSEQRAPEPDRYWENAGQVGYAEAMFVSSVVERHINDRLARVSLEIAKSLGLNSDSGVLELGCGDGSFAKEYLAPTFKSVWASDKSQAAIERAKSSVHSSNLEFHAADLTALDADTLPAADGAFLIGFLHHVKHSTPHILSALRRKAPRLIVLEPNGNHIVRKLLELTPTYRAAGEDSFRTAELKTIFANAGYRVPICQRINLFPNFTPEPIFQLLRHIEPMVEKSSILNALCTVNMIGAISDETPTTVR